MAASKLAAEIAQRVVRQALAQADAIGVGAALIGVQTQTDFPTLERDFCCNKRFPDVVPTVDYDHPLFTQVENGEVWCGAPPSDNVYNNSYTARGYLWEVDTQTWNRVQRQFAEMTAEARDLLWTKRRVNKHEYFTPITWRVFQVCRRCSCTRARAWRCSQWGRARTRPPWANGARAQALRSGS